MTGAKVGGHVWLASYPKSGNTWMRLALTSLHANQKVVDINALDHGVGVLFALRRVFDHTLDIDSSDLSPDEVFRLRGHLWDSRQKDSVQPHIWKVHDVWERTQDGKPLFPADCTFATVYLVRDPRDVAVSFAHHRDSDIDSTISLMADRNYWVGRRVDRISKQLPQHYSNWSDHVESWLDRSGLEPLLIRYEDMVADLSAVLSRVAATLGWSPTREAIADAVEATRFDPLREQERQHGFVERPHTGDFFRRGIAGGWRDTLTRAQADRIEHDHGAVMTRLGYL